MTTPVNVDDLYVHRCIEFFGAKFGLGMHWRLTGEYVPPKGRVYPQWFTNYQAVTGRIPADLFKVFPNPLLLAHGSSPNWSTVWSIEECTTIGCICSTTTAISSNHLPFTATTSTPQRSGLQGSWLANSLSRFGS
jgi:hypothetical protein